ncbi:MAG TPA: hypothetical protein VEB86_04730 [Chryseosolibacter sp.]|nr:hypothetical protein [Chryseosolibacter sp.]
MTTQQSTLEGGTDHTQSAHQTPAEKAVHNLMAAYNARSLFFAESFIKKVKDANRKALAELQRHPLPPTQMDLRRELSECVKANVADDHAFTMKDGKVYAMRELRTLVPDWAMTAEKALMESDPALADKLMTPVQWNAKCAFEVTFVTANNELRNIRKTKATATMEYYMNWIIIPLNKALHEVKAVAPPGNALIGFGNRMSLKDAIIVAEGIENQFRKLVEQKLN